MGVYTYIINGTYKCPVFSLVFPSPRDAGVRNVQVLLSLYFSLSGVVSLHLVLIGEWRHHLSRSPSGSCLLLLSTAFTTAIKSFFLSPGFRFIRFCVCLFASILYLSSLDLSFLLSCLHSFFPSFSFIFSLYLDSLLPSKKKNSLPLPILSQPYINSPDILYFPRRPVIFLITCSPSTPTSPEFYNYSGRPPCIPCRQH